MMIQMQNARKIDALILYRWRNSRSVKKYLVNPKDNSFKKHLTWYCQFLKSTDNEMYFFYKENRRCGMTRLNRVDQTNEYEVSILVAPKFQSQGLGAIILDKTLRESRKCLSASKIIAKIHRDNYPSIKMFTRFGFSKYASRNSYVFLEFTPSSKVSNT